MKVFKLLCGLFIVLNLSASTPDKNMLQNQNVIDMAAKSLSKDLPQKVDTFTSLVAVKSKPGTLVYVFEINAPASDEQIMKKDKSRMEKSIVKGVCRSSKRFLDSDIKISYVYIGAKSKKELFKFDIDKKECDFSPF